MIFQQAKDRLAKLANGRYHSLNFGQDIHENGDTVNKVWLYIAANSTGPGFSSEIQPNFDMAFRDLEVAMGIKSHEQDEIPEVNA